MTFYQPGTVSLDLSEASTTYISDLVDLLDDHHFGAVSSQISAQTRGPRFPLGAKVRFIGEITTSDTWAKRRDERHLGIVVDHFSHGEVRVYDTVEHDWWQADEGSLAAVEDES